MLAESPPQKIVLVSLQRQNIKYSFIIMNEKFCLPDKEK